MSWYKAGRVKVAKGSAVVTGWGTSFTTSVHNGDVFFLTNNKADIYEVDSVDSDTQITLATPFNGATGEMQEYAIIVNFNNTPNATLSQKLADLMLAVNQRNDEIQAWLTGTVTGGPAGNGYYPVTDVAGNVQMIPCPAMIRPPENQTVQTNDGLFSYKKYSVAGGNPPGWYQSLDIADASVHHLVLNQESCEIVFKNGNADKRFAQHISVVLEQGTGSNKIDPWPSNIRWNQSRKPILSYAKGTKDLFDFFSIDGGATWMGFYSGTQIPA